MTWREVYFRMSERFGIDGMLTRVARLPRDDRWDALARGALRDDLYAVLEAFTRNAFEFEDDLDGDGDGHRRGTHRGVVPGQRGRCGARRRASSPAYGRSRSRTSPRCRSPCDRSGPWSARGS